MEAKLPLRPMKLNAKRKKALREEERLRNAEKNIDKVPPKAAKAMKKKEVVLVETQPEKPKYSRKRIIEMPYDNDCNLLSNLGLIRHYIAYKYEVKLYLLEILLYLYDKNYWTSSDFTEFPISYSYRLQTLVKKGRIVKIAKEKGLNLYTLSLSSKRIVRHFYGLLSGEETIPDEDLDRAWKGSESTLDTKRRQLIKKLTALPVPESKRKLFD